MTRKSQIKLLLSACVLAASFTAWANLRIWGDVSSMPADTQVAELADGQWVWTPNAAPQGPIMVVVSLSEQRAHVYRNGVEIGYSSVSSGKKGHETPTGVFTTLQKDRDHHSSIYNNASMPYTQRLTWGGVALHAGGLPGYPSSHGCVHLPTKFAQALFEASPLGMTVIVSREGESPERTVHPLEVAPSAGALADTDESEDSATLVYELSPWMSQDGPLSIVLSTSDEYLVVMRNGIEIGKSKIQIKEGEPLKGTHVYMAHNPASGEPPEKDALQAQWVAVTVTGHEDEAGKVLTPTQLSRIALPESFRIEVQRMIEAGTTLVVTEAAITPHSTGTELAVLSDKSPEET
ncbi:L,D-transpeptidase [Dokdonella sp.]|uniref:L,D-transpeptidase n=1 Tax=Dokdonella sp. TaxID=2291710 RepID=UPI003C34F4BB